MGGATTKYPLLAGMLPALAFFAALAVGDDQGSGMMGGRGMMSDSHGTMMGRRMEGCMQMMQGIHSENRRPNEQWRKH
jgi:hypothetical protein